MNYTRLVTRYSVPNMMVEDSIQNNYVKNVYSDDTVSPVFEQFLYVVCPVCLDFGPTDSSLRCGYWRHGVTKTVVLECMNPVC